MVLKSSFKNLLLLLIRRFLHLLFVPHCLRLNLLIRRLFIIDVFHLLLSYFLCSNSKLLKSMIFDHFVYCWRRFWFLTNFLVFDENFDFHVLRSFSFFTKILKRVLKMTKNYRIWKIPMCSELSDLSDGCIQKTFTVEICYPWDAY